MTAPATARRAPAWPLVTIALATGVVLWLAAAAFDGRKEPWDGPFHRGMEYPVAVVACGALGWWWPQRPVLGPMLVFQGQFLGAVIRSGGDPGNPWPVAMAFFAVLAVPGVALAFLAAALRRRRAG